jgi:hypothetical protein
LNWVGLDWIERNWIGMDWNGLEWIGMDWVEVDRTGLGWNGLEWNGTVWTGREWMELDDACRTSAKPWNPYKNSYVCENVNYIDHPRLLYLWFTPQTATVGLWTGPIKAPLSFTTDDSAVTEDTPFIFMRGASYLEVDATLVDPFTPTINEQTILHYRVDASGTTPVAACVSVLSPQEYRG